MKAAAREEGSEDGEEGRGMDEGDDGEDDDSMDVSGVSLPTEAVTKASEVSRDWTRLAAIVDDGPSY
jgi:hypothetical protein